MKFSDKKIINSIFNSSESIITLKDNNLRYLKCSKGFAKLTNCEFLNRRQEEIIQCENPNKIHEILNSVIQEKVQKTFVQKIFINEREYTYQSTATPIEDCSGIITISKDITENVSLKKSLEIYISTLSHEFQIPVIAQVRALELLVDGQLGEFNNEQKEMLQLTLNSCSYLYVMVKALLSAYKYQRGEII